MARAQTHREIDGYDVFESSRQVKVSEELQNPELVEEPKVLTIDDLFNMPQDESGLKKAQEALLIPAGTYTSIPELTLTLSEREVEGYTGFEDGSIVKGLQKRQVARYFGVIMNKEGQIERIGFGFSWTPVYKEDGKPDFYTKLYLNARSVFKQAHGREGNVGEVVAYFRDEPVGVRVTQMGVGPNAREDQEPGNLVVGFSVVR